MNIVNGMFFKERVGSYKDKKGNELEFGTSLPSNNPYVQVSEHVYVIYDWNDIVDGAQKFNKEQRGEGEAG